MMKSEVFRWRLAFLLATIAIFLSPSALPPSYAQDPTVSLTVTHVSGLTVSAQTTAAGDTIDWIDYYWMSGSTADRITSNFGNAVTHTYASCGAYTVTVDVQFSSDNVGANQSIAVPCPPQEEPGSGSPPRRARRPTPTPGPIPTQDHSQLPDGAEVNSDSIWISMREVSGAAIGDPAVRAAAMSAIDIWAPLGLQAEVCFAEDGSLLLLDAAHSPRAQLWLDAYQRADGKTCARLDRNGTVVLMPAQPAAAATPAPQATATPNPYLIADNPDDAVPLEDCMVRANYVLNFRERPAGRFISLYLGNSEAIARTENWFQVEYLGETGWISAHFVTTEGDCG